MKRVLLALLALVAVSASVHFESSVNGWVHQTGTELTPPDVKKFVPPDWHMTTLCFGYCPEMGDSL